MITISTDPLIPDLTRKVAAKDLHVFESTRQVILTCHVSFFDSEGNKVENARVRSYKKELVATDTDLCDPQTGVLLTDEQLADIENLVFTPTNKFAFFMALKYVAVKVGEYEDSEIAAADQLQKFDI